MPYKDRKDLYEAQRKYRVAIRKQLLQFLSDKACIDCGENDPIVLDFDHKTQETKFKSVSKLLSGHYSWKKILIEIEKCDIRCANCHRRRTYKQLNSFGKTLPL